MRRLFGLAGPMLLVCGLSVFVTWPQALLLNAQVAAHHDAFFSIWRLGWIAHALRTTPLHIFDANIFHPAKGTLAFSDATMLEGLLGAPLFWVGLSPVLIYNLLLLAGFVGSGLGMFVLARHLTRATGPSLAAAAIFTMLPYRIEHVMHLELQWAMFIPLTFWAMHRAVEGSSWRWGIMAGLFLWLQILACVYYGGVPRDDARGVRAGPSPVDGTRTRHPCPSTGGSRGDRRGSASLFLSRSRTGLRHSTSAAAP